MSTTVRWTLLLVLALTVCFARVGHAQLVERPLIAGRHAVVTSDEPLASMAGMRVLQDGGSAFDAAVATAVAVGVLDPRWTDALRLFVVVYCVSRFVNIILRNDAVLFVTTP